MISVRKMCWVALALFSMASPLVAASSAERKAFSAAANSFQLGFYDRAEKEFARFAEEFPESDRRAEAILRQAQARYKQTNSVGAVELLAGNLDGANGWADAYHFWMGEAHYQDSNYVAAAEQYARVTRDFTNSTRLLEASYNEALAFSKMANWPRVVELLGAPTGAFQSHASKNTTNAFAIWGNLLLSEAQLAQQSFSAAAETLRPLAGRTMTSELDWRRQYLLCRIHLANGQATEALDGTSNLTAAAAASGRRELMAETIWFKADVLERVGKRDVALAVLERNLLETVPIEHRRPALLKIVHLTLAQNQSAAAVRRLEQFLEHDPESAAADAALLSLGELHLKEYQPQPDREHLTNGVVALPFPTNHLQQALGRFDALIERFPDSPLVGKAHLDRGWCFWLSGNFPESLRAFAQAVERLPEGEDAAVARIKLADALYASGDVRGAITNYERAITQAGALTNSTSILELALYQATRAALDSGDITAATNHLARILEQFPNSFVCDRGILLVGQKLSHHGSYAQARALFNRAVVALTNSELSTELELAIARTYEQEGNWSNAIATYDAALTTKLPPAAQPRAEFYRAWAQARAGNETNALSLFTNFVARFAANEFAPLAQNWIADFHFRRGDFKSAEENYQLLFQQWPQSALSFQAYMMAGRAAMAREGLKDAQNYFTSLINNPLCPPDLLAQAFFAYGDTWVAMKTAATNQPLANYEEAIRVFNKIPQLFKTNALVPLAYGRLGDCYKELGALDATQYQTAIQMYQHAIDSPLADVAVRSQAHCGLALVLTKLAEKMDEPQRSQLLNQAMNHHLDVLFGTILRDEEQPDSFWTKKAGLEAGKLAEDLQQFDKAVSVYQRLAELLPPLRAQLEKRIAKVQEQGTQKK